MVEEAGTVREYPPPEDLVPVVIWHPSSWQSADPGATIVEDELLGVAAIVNPREYAAADPDDAPEFAVVNEKELALITVIIPLKLSALAFLTITNSPEVLPWLVCVIVRVVVDLVHERPVLTVADETR